MNGADIGAVLLAGFAVFWVAAGTRTLPPPWRGRLFWSALAVSALVVFGAVRHAHSPTATASAGHFDGRLYGLAVAFESVAIPVAAAILRRTGRPRYILPVIAGIVGVHFFPLVWAIASTEFWWIGGAMCALSLGTVSLLPPTLAWRGALAPAAEPVDLWGLVVGVGCALILWVSGLSFLA